MIKDKTGKIRTLEYTGKYSEYQLSGNTMNGKKYGLQGNLNNYQIFLYNRALYGLSVYTQEEIKRMHFKKRSRIIKVHKRTTEIINVWKQEIVNTLSTKFFQALFPKTEFTKFMVDTHADTDKDFGLKISLKELGITKKQVIQRLIFDGILPANFYELAER